MAIKVDVQDYKNTFGSSPKGLGNWLFSLGRNGSWTEFKWIGTYKVAKAFALKEAKQLGCDQVVLQS